MNTSIIIAAVVGAVQTVAGLIGLLADVPDWIKKSPHKRRYIFLVVSVMCGLWLYGVWGVWEHSTEEEKKAVQAEKDKQKAEAHAKDQTERLTSLQTTFATEMKARQSEASDQKSLIKSQSTVLENESKENDQHRQKIANLELRISELLKGQETSRQEAEDSRKVQSELVDLVKEEQERRKKFLATGDRSILEDIIAESPIFEEPTFLGYYDFPKNSLAEIVPNDPASLRLQIGNRNYLLICPRTLCYWQEVPGEKNSPKRYGVVAKMGSARVSLRKSAVSVFDFPNYLTPAKLHFNDEETSLSETPFDGTAEVIKVTP